MARKLPNLSGITFGRLYALRRVKTGKGSKWYCFCSCGGRALVVTGALRRGTTKSCGCLRLEALAEARNEKARQKGKPGEGARVQDIQETDSVNSYRDAVDDAVYALGIKLSSD